MKLLGIIGGIAPESTIEYYRSIVAAYRRRRPGAGYPHRDRQYRSRQAPGARRRRRARSADGVALRRAREARARRRPNRNPGLEHASTSCSKSCGAGRPSL